MPLSTRIRNPFARSSAASPEQRGTPNDAAATAGSHTAPKGPRFGRARLVPAAAAATALVVGGGTAAFASAHKSVTLDVDGTVSHVSTFAGSVDALLDDHGVRVGERDEVSPRGGLKDGAEVVVRHARQLTVAQDGTERSVWTTALTADEALDALAIRGDVALVASRSAAGGRPEIALDLTLHGPADVLVDGAVLLAPDADTRVAQVLGDLGVTLGPLDRVSVRQADSGRVQVVVNRVAVQDVTTTQPVAFASTTKPDPARFTDQRRTVTAGVPGVRTLVERVTTVDGAETARTPVSDEVTQAPVDEVVAVGTKVRPVVPKAPKAPAAPAAQPAAAQPAAAQPAATPVAAGGGADGLNWAALAACESGGNPSIVSKNGKYHGLYQFSVGTWQAVGGTGLPSQASAEEQTARAQALYNRSGAGQWPACGKRLFS